MNKLVNVFVRNKIPNTKGNFIIYNINQIKCVSFANEALRVLD